MGICGSKLPSHAWDTLQSSPYMERTESSRVNDIVQLGTVLDVEERRQIYAKGDYADSFFLVLEGEVAMTANTQFLCKWTGGEGFGEEALADDGAMLRLATATALSDCMLLEIEREVFQRNRKRPFMTAFAECIDNINTVRKARFLRSVPFLRSQHVPDADLETVAALFSYQIYDYDDEICAEDSDEGPAFYIVCSGRVAAFMNINGIDVSLHDLKPGDYYGEVALVENVPNTTSLRSLSRTTLLVLPSSNFEAFLAISPTVRHELSQHGRQRTAAALRRYNVPFFNSLSDHAMERLASLCRIRQYEKDDVVCQVNTRGDAFYIVTHGRLTVAVPGSSARTLAQGDYFGEISLVADKPRAATVTAAENATVLLEVSKENFTAIFSHEPHALAEIEIKVLGEQAQLYSILNHEAASGFFRQQLEREFADENIAFWRDADHFYKVHSLLESSRAFLLQETADAHPSERTTYKRSSGPRDPKTVHKTQSVFSKEDVPRRAAMQYNRASDRTIKSVNSEEPAAPQDNPAAEKERLMEREMLRRRRDALKIYETYIRVDSPKEINIQQSMKRAIEQRVTNEEFTVDMFEVAKTEIYTLMERDNFARFQKSDLFQEMLEALNVYRAEPSQVELQFADSGEPAISPLASAAAPMAQSAALS